MHQSALLEASIATAMVNFKKGVVIAIASTFIHGHHSVVERYFAKTRLIQQSSAIAHQGRPMAGSLLEPVAEADLDSSKGAGVSS